MLLQESEQFCNNVLLKKYSINENEKSIDDIAHRISSSVPSHISSKIYNLMKNRKFLPAGSILYGLGNNSTVSLSNCYYIPFLNDSIESIFQCLAEAARVYSWRGGVGVNITTLRPKNTEVNNAAKTSSGSVSFMPLISNVTSVIGQNGRRGASLIVLDYRHPDIVDFIKSKSKPEEVFQLNNSNDRYPNLSSCNISVLLGSEIFESMDKDIDLVFPDIHADKETYNKVWKGDYDEWINNKYPLKKYDTIKARDLLRMIAEEAWNTGDPGVIYWDNVISNTFMSLHPRTKPRGLNPCGEQVLSDYGNCLLLCSNLSEYVIDPWTSRARFDYESYLNDIETIFEFGDYIVDINKHPLQQQNELAQFDRKIGHETTGLADCLAKLNLVYGSKESLEFIDELYSKKAGKELLYEIEMAKEKGCCPLLQENPEIRQQLIKHDLIKRMIESATSISNYSYDEIVQMILKYGLRNFGWSTQGPCGSLSIVLGNVTSGIEPLFSLDYYRETKLEPGKKTRILHTPLLKHIVSNNLCEEVESLSKLELLEKFSYIESHNIDYHDRIKVQSVVQKWITDSISSTINLPKESTVDDIMNIFVLGWKYNLKGITIYRNGCNNTSVLQSVEQTKTTADKTESALVEKQVKEEDDSKRYIIRWKKFKVYVNVTHDENGYPTEMFAHLPFEAGLDVNDNLFSYDILLERMSYWDSICRLVGVCLRFGVPLKEVIKQLKKSTYNITHLTSSITRILSKYPLIKKNSETSYDVCPSCKQQSYKAESGCSYCVSCGYSKCD